MSLFPRTEVGGVSLSRLIIGTNWFLGYSHTSLAKDTFIRSHQDRKRIADVLEVYLSHGIDTVMGWHGASPVMVEAIREAQDRTGKKIIMIDTPNLAWNYEQINWDITRDVMDESMSFGATFFLPHQCSTDAMLDRSTRQIRYMDDVCKLIRERGMIPGLSTHMPESIVYADESGLDVATYVQIYNALGFMMQVEVDWVHRIIQNAKHPVLTIKPMAAGRLIPLVGLAFSWSTIRDQDMVAVGAMTADEAKEDIELSLSLLERRAPELILQKTRSKKSLESQVAPSN
jgi:hypothetical protein